MVLDRHSVSSNRESKLATLVSDGRGLERKRAVVLSSKADSPFVVFRHGKVVDIIPVWPLGYSHNLVTLEGQLSGDYSAHIAYAKTDHVHCRFINYGRHDQVPPDAACWYCARLAGLSFVGVVATMRVCWFLPSP